MEQETKVLEARAKGVEVKGEYNAEPIKGLKIRYGNTGQKSGVFVNPGAAINDISSALKNTDKALSTLDNLTSALTNFSTTNSSTIKIVGDRALTALSAIGLVDPKKVFGEKEMSDENYAQALQDAIVQEFKRFLTQETGNGISNVDVQNIKELLGAVSLFKNPTEYLKRVELVRSIFINKRNKIRDLTNDLMDENNFRNNNDFLYSQDKLNDLLGGFEDFKIISGSNNIPRIDLTS